MSAFHDLTGKRFGRLVVVSFVGREKSKALWLCLCDCGKEKTIIGGSLVTKRTTSCGCAKIESCRENVKQALKYSTHKKHGHAIAKNHTRTYRTWSSIKTRCFNANFPNYKYYGGRGITVCDRWKNSFEAFLEDMGEKPLGLEIDRINNNGNYAPGNCRWTTRSVNVNNRNKFTRPKRKVVTC